MDKTVILLNGPNLNMLGTREPDMYGSTNLDNICEYCVEKAKQLGFTLDCIQSNHEGELITAIQDARNRAQGIIINAGAYTHTSIGIRDALLSISLPIIEIHMSNIYKREDFRHQSYLSDIADGIICGFGEHSYYLAIDAIQPFLVQN